MACTMASRAALQAAGPGPTTLASAARAFPTAAASAQTAVLSWGVGLQGALGTGGTRDQQEPEMIRSSLPSNVVAVGAGHMSSFAVTAEGGLWSWGRGKEGQLGRQLAHTDFGVSPLPARVEALAGRHVVAVTGSGVCTFCLTRDGALLAFGASKRGQLGLGAGAARSAEPRQLRLPRAAVAASAGWGHAAALLDDGSVWTWGWPAHGRLGHSWAASAADEEEGRLHERCCWEPQRVEALDGVRITQVACGFDHTLALSADGSLFSFGDGSLGQLGRPAQAQGEHLRPRSAQDWLVNPAGGCGGETRFVQVAAGLGHCLGLLDSGALLAWGWNGGGQCGLGDLVADECVAAPTPVHGAPPSRRALLAAGRVHSVLVLVTREQEGRQAPVGDPTQCLSWGSSAGGRLGTGMFEDAASPELVPDVEEEVVGLACGLDHTLALCRAAGPA